MSSHERPKRGVSLAAALSALGRGNETAPRPKASPGPQTDAGALGQAVKAAKAVAKRDRGRKAKHATVACDDATIACSHATVACPDGEHATIAHATIAYSPKHEFRAALERAGLTLAEFARLTGEPARTVAEWGRPGGDHDPRPIAVALAKVLATSVNARSILEAFADGRCQA